MPRIARNAAYAYFLILSTACALLPASNAAAFPILLWTNTAVEYYNRDLDHYVMVTDGSEIRDIDTGKAGPGWIRTGYGFGVYPYPVPSGAVCPRYCGEPVSRFYGTPGLGPNSHFFTGDPAEAAGLKQPGTGWSFEKVAFAVALPDAAGNCNSSGRTPVYRFYNNRWMFNDSNHRYVTSVAERARMQAKGWIDEGVKFCAYGEDDVALAVFAVLPDLTTAILPSAACEDETQRLGSCMAVNNLPPPTILYPAPIGQSPPLAFGDVTGMNTYANYVASTAPASIAATDRFVQRNGTAYGIHVDTRARGASIYSSINPLYQFKTTVTPGTADARLFPFARIYENDAQIVVKFLMNVRTVNLRNSASHAYGHPTIEFIDQRSGRHLYLTALAYGTVAAADFVAPDVATGKVIVGTTFRNDSPFMRNFGTWTFPTPSGFVPENPWGRGGQFEYRVDRAEMRRAVDAARVFDPALSADPADYLVDNFHFTNEVVGDGEIGMNITDFVLQIRRR